VGRRDCALRDGREDSGTWELAGHVTGAALVTTGVALMARLW
jgi:hypothetical protein